MNHKFSNNTKDLIEKSRLVAMDLGCTYISTVHFFLADCELNKIFSIKKFSFSDETAYWAFHKSQKIDEPSILVPDSLPLTKEAMMVILNASVEKRCYTDALVEPYHIFLAACKYKKSLLYGLFSHVEGVAERLEEYYLAIGQIKKENIANNLLYKLSKFVSFFRPV